MIIVFEKLDLEKNNQLHAGFSAVTQNNGNDANEMCVGKDHAWAVLHYCWRFCFFSCLGRCRHQVFRKALTRMFEAQESDAIFFETAMNLKRFPHMVLECVPLAVSAGETAPIYFKVGPVHFWQFFSICNRERSSSGPCHFKMVHRDQSDRPFFYHSYLERCCFLNYSVTKNNTMKMNECPYGISTIFYPKRSSYVA